MASETRYLCFHGVGEPRRELEPGEDRLWISTGQLTDILDAIAGEAVGITFDDGNASDVDHALPALSERGRTATFFPIAGRLGDRGSLSADGVRTLRDAGMGIGSHGMDHVPWRRLSPEQVQRELVDARRILEEIVERPVDTAAFPFGAYDRRSLGELAELGYRRAFSSDGLHRRPWRILHPRYSVRAPDDGDSISALLRHRPPPRARFTGQLKQIYKRNRR